MVRCLSLRHIRYKVSMYHIGCIPVRRLTVKSSFVHFSEGFLNQASQRKTWINLALWEKDTLNIHNLCIVSLYRYICLHTSFMLDLCIMYIYMYFYNTA